LLQGAKTERVEGTFPGQRERLVKRGEHVGAGFGAHLTDRRGGRVDRWPGQQRRAARGGRIGTRDFRQAERHAGVAGTAPKHARLADHDGRRVRVDFARGHQPGDQLRADAAGIAEQQSDPRGPWHDWSPQKRVRRRLYGSGRPNAKPRRSDPPRGEAIRPRAPG
jgi:hypothetical protein